MILQKARVKEVASNKPNASTAFNLPDSAPTGYRSFDSILATNDITTYYATNGTAWEEGLGTFTSGSPDTLARTTIYDSSTGSAIDWSSGGDVTVFIALSSNLAQQLLNPGYVSISSDASTTQSFPGETVTKVTSCLVTEVADTSGWWDNTNKVFQPTIAGIYLITASMQLTAVSDGQNVQSILYKNGSVIAYGPSSYSAEASGGPASAITDIINLNGTTDYIEYYYYNGDSVSRSNIAGVGRVVFRAVYLGAI